MNILSLLKTKAKQIINGDITDIFNEHPGIDLKRMLGIENFKYAYIQKVMNYSRPVYVVTVDSKYPSIRISRSTLDHADFSFAVMVDVKYRKFVPKFANLTPPLLLDVFTGTIPEDALILFRDFAGEYQLGELMYEKFEIKNISKSTEVI